LPAKLVAFLLALALCASAQNPKLLLTPQRLKRLQRDRERQTDRWLNFEHRVQTAPGSPERGFELALYYAVTQDKARAAEAAQWALKHPCELRQVALISDWTGSAIPEASSSCPAPHAGSVGALRDSFFLAAAAGNKGESPKLDPELLRTNAPDGLYDAVEYLDAVRSTQHIDLRERNRGFFSSLPQRFLLSMRPEEVEHPQWKAHIAALALATIDPNLEGSQFLQGWGMEDRFTLRDGPGVAYEFLWANPYLPGVSYQNMDPWLYDLSGLLIARGGWSQLACWIQISPSGLQQQNCPPNWQSQVVVFGHLTLIPVNDKCIQVERVDRNESIILWYLKPQTKLIFTASGENRSAEADPAGMWHTPEEVRGKVCVHR